jgi:hypothetical protein
MKVALVYPRWQWYEYNGLAEPIGVLHLVSVLRNAGHEPVYMDYSSCRNITDIDHLASGCDLVGIAISAAAKMGRARDVLTHLRTVVPDAHFTVGGAYPSIFPGQSIEGTGADSAMVGEAEETIVELAGAAEKLIAHLGLGYRRPMRGAPVPPCRGGVQAGRDRVLLAGDAAGLCDRVSGEGIPHALESGFLAAEALIAGASSWDTRARCVRQIRDSGRYRHLLYAGPFRNLAMRKLRDSERFMQTYWEIAAGESRYSALLQRRAARMLSAT